MPTAADKERAKEWWLELFADHEESFHGGDEGDDPYCCLRLRQDRIASLASLLAAEREAALEEAAKIAYGWVFRIHDGTPEEIARAIRAHAKEVGE